jgi:putative protein kinase ArgK-like GTPase of G3E family
VVGLGQAVLDVVLVADQVVFLSTTGTGAGVRSTARSTWRLLVRAL